MQVGDLGQVRVVALGGKRVRHQAVVVHVLLLGAAGHRHRHRLVERRRAQDVADEPHDPALPASFVEYCYPRAQLERLGLEGDDLVAARSIAEQPAVYSEIVDSGLLGAPALRKLIYVLGITRQLDLGGDALPVGVDDPNVDRMRSRSSSVARVRLVTASFRVGVAAPDLPGDGERAAVSPSARRRKRSLSGSVEISDDPVSSDSPSSPRPAADPSSAAADLRARRPSLRAAGLFRRAPWFPGNGREPRAVGDARGGHFVVGDPRHFD